MSGATKEIPNCWKAQGCLQVENNPTFREGLQTKPALCLQRMQGQEISI